jgi:hypothetical protein
MDYSLSFVSKAEEIAISIDRDKKALVLLASQRANSENEMVKARELLQKQQDALKKAKELSIEKGQEWHKEFEKSRAAQANKEKAEIKLHGVRIDQLQATETELKGIITRLERERKTIEKGLGKLKSSITEID